MCASYRSYNSSEKYLLLLCLLTLMNILVQTDVKWKICICSLLGCLNDFFHGQSEGGGLTLTHPFVLDGAVSSRPLC